MDFTEHFIDQHTAMHPYINASIFILQYQYTLKHYVLQYIDTSQYCPISAYHTLTQ